MRRSPSKPLLATLLGVFISASITSSCGALPTALPTPTPTSSPQQLYASELRAAMPEIDGWLQSLAELKLIEGTSLSCDGSQTGYTVAEVEAGLALIVCDAPQFVASVEKRLNCLGDRLSGPLSSIIEGGRRLQATLGAIDAAPEMRVYHADLIRCVSAQVNAAVALEDLQSGVCSQAPETLSQDCRTWKQSLNEVKTFAAAN